jgi:hypothetical protein
MWNLDHISCCRTLSYVAGLALSSGAWQGLFEYGKKPKQIIIAAMRKLLHQIDGILKSGQPYNPRKTRLRRILNLPPSTPGKPPIPNKSLLHLQRSIWFLYHEGISFRKRRRSPQQSPNARFPPNGLHPAPISDRPPSIGLARGPYQNSDHSDLLFV